MGTFFGRGGTCTRWFEVVKGCCGWDRKWGGGVCAESRDKVLMALLGSLRYPGR